MVGNTLGHYQITNQLGKGGMGEVYRARDMKLNRDVALKVLPAEFANDPERMARFKREAQLLASLNHTNIAGIYGLEESGGVSALVMELAEGPTLADRISKGPIPVDEALVIAKQITEALEAAHEKGIIHRDLKPANIKVTPEGAVKVLDFGLAKALEGEAAAADASQSPTLSLAATKAGIILGTAAYMSPEQARGSAVDKRCDIWSFGVVLFEMLTGKQLFAGETVSDTLAAVLRADIDWNLLPASTPASIRALLRRGLNKDRKQRLQAIGDARIVIEENLANPANAVDQEPASAANNHKHIERLAWIGAVVLLIAASSALGIAYYRKVSEPRQVTRFEYTLSDDQQFSHTVGEPFLAVSPDGRQFAYSTNKGLFVRSLDKQDAQCVVSAKEKPANPFYSPDCQWIAYRSEAENKLKKVSAQGGAPVVLCDVGTFSGAYWGTDDTITYCDYGNASMIRVSANGGNPELLFKGDANLYFHPQLLPDGKSLMFTLSPYPYSIATRSPGSRESKLIISPGDRAFYLPTGHLVYGLKDYLYAVSFDPSALRQTGAPINVIEGVYRPDAGSAPQFDVSSSGTLIYAQIDLPKRTLVWVNRDGKEEPIDIQQQDYIANYSTPRISPDGTQLAYAAATGRNINIYIWDLIRKNTIKLTDDEGESSWPLWTPDSRQIVYRSSRNLSAYTVNRKAADGSAEAEILGSLQKQDTPGPFSWSKDGKILSWEAAYSPQRCNIVTLSINAGIASKLLLEGKRYAQHPQISPDGRWLAYASDESGQNEVYVCPFPEVKRRRWMVSTNGGYGPLWSPDGRELFYRIGESIMAVPVETDPIFNFRQPKELFKGRYFYARWSAAMFPMWDISPKDKRFLMVKETGSPAAHNAGARKINVVMNWTEELKQRVPVK